MNAKCILCQIGKELIWVPKEDIAEIQRIKQYCDTIAFERICQYLREKYPEEDKRIDP